MKKNTFKTADKYFYSITIDIEDLLKRHHNISHLNSFSIGEIINTWTCDMYGKDTTWQKDNCIDSIMQLVEKETRMRFNDVTKLVDTFDSNLDQSIAWAESSAWDNEYFKSIVNEIEDLYSCDIIFHSADDDTTACMWFSHSVSFCFTRKMFCNEFDITEKELAAETRLSEDQEYTCEQFMGQCKDIQLDSRLEAYASETEILETFKDSDFFAEVDAAIKTKQDHIKNCIKNNVALIYR